MAEKKGSFEREHQIVQSVYGWKEKRMKMNHTVSMKVRGGPGAALFVATSVVLGLAACEGRSTETADRGIAKASSPNNQISVERLNRIEGVLQEDVEAGLRSGYAVMVAKDGEVVYQTYVGMADREQNIVMSDDTRFRIASMTKAVTTTAILQLVEDGKLLLSDPVAKYIPAFASIRVATSHTAAEDGSFATEELKRPITIHHLLTHTDGFDYSFIPMSDLAMRHASLNPYRQEGDLAARVEKLTSLPLFEQPGEKYRYGFGTDIAGRVVEVVSGLTLEDFMKERIFNPLGMKDTEFFLDESDFERLAMVYSVNADGDMAATSADPFKPVPNSTGQGWMSGGGGLISTTSDYTRFLMMLLNEGELGGVRILSPSSVELMLQRSISDDVLNPERHSTPDLARTPGAALGLGGYVIEEPGLYGSLAAKGQWGWEGYYDSSAFISPEDELAVVIMAQHSPWEKPPSRAKGRVKAIVYGALEGR